MEPLGKRRIKIADILADNRLRAVDPAWVDMLVANIRESGGLKVAIEVRELKGGPGHPPAYALIAGGHRLAAAQALGWAEIDAEVFACTVDEARLREIDENLMRHELSPFDRAEFMHERKQLHLKLHPETAQHAAGGHGKARGGVSASDIVSFAADTAERLGWNVKTIERAVSIAANLTAESKARIRGTEVAKCQADLLALAKLGPKEQAAALDAYFGGDDFKNLRAAIATLGDRPAREPDHAARLVTAWIHANKTAKTAFLHFIKRDVNGMGWRLEEMAAPSRPSGQEAEAPETATQGEIAAARVDGYGAYQDEIPRTGNPYGGATRRDQQLAAAWLQGWDEAAEDSEDIQEKEQAA